MADCSISAFLAAADANVASTGRDAHTLSKNSNPTEISAYERVMAEKFGLGYDDTESISMMGVLEAHGYNAKGPKNLADDALWAWPSEQFPQYAAKIDELIENTPSAGSDKGVFLQEAVPELRAKLDDIHYAITNAADKAEIKSNLAELGLTPDNAYFAVEWTKWLIDGGHHQYSKWDNQFTKIAGNVAKAQATYKMPWTLGNVVDLIRPVSYYSHRPGGMSAILKGIGEANKRGLFKQDPELKAAGVYRSSHLDRPGGENWHPFAWSITAQKNLVWHTDKAFGRDGHTGIRDLLFDSKPWDRPYYDRAANSTLVFGLARYTLSEGRWMNNKIKAAFMPSSLPEVRNAALKDLMVYHGLKIVIAGPKSVIPAFGVVATLGTLTGQFGTKEQKEFLQEFEDKTGLNVIRHTTGMDVSSYTSPYGGSLGARAGSLGTTANQAGKSASMALADVFRGKPVEAVIRATAAASAVANLTGGNLGRIGQVPDAGNSTTITAVLDKLAENLENGADLDTTEKAIMKAVMGSMYQSESEPSMSRDRSRTRSR